jgi:hypothetical protein
VVRRPRPRWPRPPQIDHRFALSICLLAVGFRAVAGEGYSKI